MRADDVQRAAAIVATVRDRRVSLGVSQQYLATVAGCSLGTVRTIEAGPPSLDMALRVDAALDQIKAEVSAAIDQIKAEVSKAGGK